MDLARFLGWLVGNMMSPHGILIVLAILAFAAWWRGWMDKPPAKDMTKHELDKYQG
jgi:hypothetical protein